MTSRTEPAREENQSLWMLIVGPTIWAAHFLLSYITAAIWCAKYAGPGGSLGSVRAAIAWYTALAIAGICAAGWYGFRRHSHGEATAPHDADTPDDRHRFLGLATLMLAGLSAVATVYVALAAAFIESCR